MSDEVNIRILENEPNRRGDRFTQMMGDLFLALGYGPPRLNIHKSGREIDLEATHRVERRRALAECKATAVPIGGDDLNKFAGVLSLEKDQQDGWELTGYFISLAGFKETAVEQERTRQRDRIVLLSGPKVVAELVDGKCLISKERATELAGRCCVETPELTLDSSLELLAHRRGWIWVVYYTQGKERTHFVLIHADGTLLARTLANEVIASDRECSGTLHSIVCLNPERRQDAISEGAVADALGAYRKYLSEECGFIQLDGLPADADVGGRRLRLEKLFVPLHLDVEVRGEAEQKKQGRTVGEVLSEHTRLAILASPGGGKSTLIKRLAVAYADPARREQTDDGLPARNWLPVFFRCRELRGLARASFDELLEALCHKELVRQHATVFRACVERALLEDRALLLVDGLDEISDPGDRAAFVCTLRTAICAYPGTAIVVTSREAGFRHVAAHLEPICTRSVVSPFTNDDIRRLSVAWHREVVGGSDKVRSDAEQLATAISRNDRIRRLAVNPLLFTTLLLVKRWLGALPTRRTVLYGKAVEVLLRTWNTEGHEPISEDEALPQLCFVAAAMMTSRVERISRPRLAALLREARAALPAELGYVQGTVEAFITRVEERSSLLMMTGIDIEDGQLVEFFEFRHLTFQEFLTALAFVGGWHQNRSETDTLASVLQHHLDDEKFSEVVPLAAVLGGKQSDALIKMMTEILSATNGPLHDHLLLAVTLGNCLADEPQSPPETIRSALRVLVCQSESVWLRGGFAPALIRGKYGIDLREESRKVLAQSFPDHHFVASVAYTWFRAIETEDTDSIVRGARQFLELLTSSERIVRCEGALGVSYLFFRIFTNAFSIGTEYTDEIVSKAVPQISSLLFSDDPPSQICASVAICFIGACRLWIPTRESLILQRLAYLCETGETPDVKNKAATALTSFPLVDRGPESWFAGCSDVDETMLSRFWREEGPRAVPLRSLIVAWYSRSQPDSIIMERARRLMHDRTPESHLSAINELLRLLGVEKHSDIAEASTATPP